jgi:hypothetical protein
MRMLPVVLVVAVLLAAGRATPAELPTIQSCVDRCAPHFLDICGNAVAAFPERTVVPCPPTIAGALLAGVVFRALFEPDVQEPPVTGR